MKKSILITAILLCGFFAAAQVKIGDNITTVNSNSVLEMESTNKGFLHPRVTLVSTISPLPLTAHVEGMVVYNTATVADVRPGLYINNGTSWQAATVPPAATVTATCNGFAGDFSAGTGSRTFSVTYTNNSFTAAQVTPLATDLVLSPASGLTVASVSPNATAAINPGATLLVTYTLGGTLSAPVGTVITGTFTKLNLSCSSTVTVGESLPEGPVPAPVVPTVNIETPDGTLTFMKHNLGADMTADPDTPAQAIHGNMYYGGTSIIAATAADGDGAPTGWDNSNAIPNNWNSGTEAVPVKSADDPCPSGFRIPTKSEFDALLAAPNLTVNQLGTIDNSSTNYSSGITFIINGASITFPYSGTRNAQGSLNSRGARTMLATSTTDGTNYYILRAGNNLAVGDTSNSFVSNRGFSIRCIQE